MVFYLPFFHTAEIFGCTSTGYSVIRLFHLRSNIHTCRPYLRIKYEGNCLTGILFKGIRLKGIKHQYQLNVMLLHCLRLYVFIMQILCRILSLGSLCHSVVSAGDPCAEASVLNPAVSGSSPVLVYLCRMSSLISHPFK